MLDMFAAMTEAAARRYGFFLDVLRAQADRVMRSDPTDAARREEAISVVRLAAREYVAMEQSFLNDNSVEIARAAHDQATSDLGLMPRPIEDRFADFIFNAALHTARLVSAQVERDATAIAQHLRIGGQRVDLYVRTTGLPLVLAVAQVQQDDIQSPAFRFIDRVGRQYKSSKHIRDIYRHHLLSTYNEIYLDVVAEHGHATVAVSHPDANYRWNGATLALIGGLQHPLYYDVRDEIFHPSSSALLTLVETI